MPAHLWRVEETPVQRLLLSPLLPLEGLYRLGARLHRGAYRRGWLERVRLPARVVSVGNLCVGGSGKTPLVAWLAAELRRRGHRVAVLSRGVGGGQARAVNVVSDGERMLAGPGDVGDEPVWIAGAAPGVPVLAGRNRAALGLRALALFSSEVLLLDDGFQHHRLARDVDLVCVDGRLGLGNRHVLPRGPLRESPAALQWADAVAITRPGKTQVPGSEALPATLPRFGFELVPAALRDVATGDRLEPTSLESRRVGLVSGIARPDRLRDDVCGLGAEVIAERVYPDHHGYLRQEVEALDAAFPWVTTAKDAVKIPSVWARGRRLWVLEERVAAGSGTELLTWLGRKLGARSEPA